LIVPIGPITLPLNSFPSVCCCKPNPNSHKHINGKPNPHRCKQRKKNVKPKQNKINSLEPKLDHLELQ
jgi:hypothetical protein